MRKRYPASGYRNRTTGVLGTVGNGGSSWASAPSGINALYLWLDNYRLYSGYVGARAYGIQVRCLRE